MITGIEKAAEGLNNLSPTATGGDATPAAPVKPMTIGAAGKTENPGKSPLAAGPVNTSNNLNWLTNPK